MQQDQVSLAVIQSTGNSAEQVPGPLLLDLEALAWVSGGGGGGNELLPHGTW